MDLNQTKPKPRPDDVPVGNVKRESGEKHNITVKHPKEFGDLEYRADLDTQLSWNPIARLGFDPDKHKVIRSGLDPMAMYLRDITNFGKRALEKGYISPEEEAKIKDDNIITGSDVSVSPVIAHEFTHRGFNTLRNKMNEDPEAFEEKYGKQARRLLETTKENNNYFEEYYVELFDDLDTKFNSDAFRDKGFGDNLRKTIQSSKLGSNFPLSDNERYRNVRIRQIKSFQDNIEKARKKGKLPIIARGSTSQEINNGILGLMDAAQDILTEQGEPPKAKRKSLSFFEKLGKKFGFDEGGLAQDDQMEKLDLARSYGVTVVDPEETSETVKALGKAAIESIPGISTATTIRDIKEELQEEDPSLAKIGMLAASEAVGMIPGLGQVGKTIIRKTSTKLVDKAADAKEAERLIKNSEALEQWRKENKLPESQRQKNPEGSKKAASDLLEGEITSKEARQRIKDFIPDPQEFTAEQVLDMMPSLTQITGALGKKAKKYPIIGVKGKDLDQGQVVSSRLDIPAYDDYDTWVVSIHDGNQKSGSVVGYGQAIRLKNINFGSDPKTALDIARGKRLVQATGEDAPKPQGKATIARIFGEYQPEDPYDLQRQAAEIISSGSEEWTQIGMNPYRGSAFYNKKTGAPVFEADEIIQVGPLVLAKNVKKPTISQMKQMAVRTRDGKLRMFNEGGTAMKDQMQMAFKDDGMTKDPVSGNEVPPGSLAKEVRDDIPAMLSEGEYVVPADVLRFYGVNFFENLRNQAKSGLQTMENTGRIGGDPMSPQQVQQNMSGKPMAGSPPAQPVAANTGPAMLGQQSQTGTNTATTGQAAQNTFAPMNFSTVGFSQFQQPNQKPTSVTSTKTYVNASNTSDTRIVTYVDGVITPASDSKYTQPPYYLMGSPALAEAIKGAPIGGGGGGGGGGGDTDPPDPNAWAEGITDPEAWARENLEKDNVLALGVSVARTRALAITAEAEGDDDLAETLRKLAREAVEEKKLLQLVPEGAMNGTSIASALQKEKDLVNSIFGIKDKEKEIIDPEESFKGPPKKSLAVRQAEAETRIAAEKAKKDRETAIEKGNKILQGGGPPGTGTTIKGGKGSTPEDAGKESIGPSGSGSGAFNKGGLMKRKKKKGK